MTKTKIKKYLAYGLKWQGGTPIIAGVMYLLPFGDVWVKTILANIIGAIIFYPIDLKIFGMKDKKEKEKDNG